MAKGLVLLLCVFLTQLVGCLQRFTPRTVQSFDLQITPVSGTNDCKVSKESVDLHTAASTVNEDQIQWCATNAQYYIHFTNNSGNNSPFDINDIVVPMGRCSGYKQPVTGRPLRAYKYEVHLSAGGTMSPTTCEDPKVILK